MQDKNVSIKISDSWWKLFQFPDFFQSTMQLLSTQRAMVLYCNSALLHCDT